MISYGAAITLTLTIVLFMLGFFKYEPIAVLSNSMVPTYTRGDVLIYEKMSLDDLKKLEVNSIIIYSYHNQSIAHRIVEIVKKDDKVQYRTMGDNNNAEDPDLVSVDQIIGVYKTQVKYIGFPSVWLHDFITEEKAAVETK